MITLAVFDIAGTTVEEHGAVYDVLTATVRAAGAPVTEADVSRWMGADKRTAIENLLALDGVAPDPARVDDTYREFRRGLDETYRRTPPSPMPGATEMLRELRARGIRTALTTGFDREVTAAVLAPCGWGDLLDTVACAPDVVSGRPAPYLIFRAMEATGTASVHEVLTAGDTTLDLWAGANAGVALNVGVLTGGHDRATLSQAPHTHILDGVAAIPALLADQGAVEPIGA